MSVARPRPRCVARRGAAALAALALFAGAASAQSPGHPNIVMVAIDDMAPRVAALGALDDLILDPVARARATPHLDRLAALGASFLNAQTAAPVCNASRAALLTGIGPATSGLTTNFNNQHFRFAEALRYAVTLPQVLRQPDGTSLLYQTFATGKLFHTPATADLAGSGPNPGGFTVWDATPNNAARNPPPGTPIDGERFVVEPWNLKGLEWQRQIPTWRGRDVVDPAVLAAYADAQSDQQKPGWAARLVRDDAPGGAPKFVAAGIFPPHLPWAVPTQFFDRFPLAAIAPPVGDPNGLADIGARGHRLGRPAEHQHVLAHGTDPAFPGERDLAWRLAIQAYLAAAAYADDGFGKVLREVERKNADGDPSNDWTLVVWSDHGQHLGEKERWKKFTLWDESARSLLMIWQPGTTHPGSRIELPVDFVDVFPTIAELAGVPAPPQVQGRSLVDLLRDPAARGENFAVTTTDGPNHAVRSRRWRYIRYEDGGEELYDHFRDPDEFFNLLHESHAARAAELGAGFVGLVHRAHASALARWSVLTASTFARSGLLPLEQLPVAGTRHLERFSGSGAISQVGFTVQPQSAAPPASAFVLGGGAARAAPGARQVATWDGHTLGAGEDFVLSARVEWKGDTAGLGLVFGERGADEGYELQLVNQHATASDGVLDVRLLRRSGGVEEALVRGDDLVRLEDPHGAPFDFRAGRTTLVVDYTAATRRLELLVQDRLGVNQFRHALTLDEPLPAGSRFGLASWSASGGGSFDDFVLLAYQPIATLGSTLELAAAELLVEEGTGAGARVVVVRSGGQGAVSVRFRTAEDEAWAQADFAAASGVLEWAEGEVGERSIEVTVLPDELVEIDESFALELFGVNGPAALAGPSRARVRIRDDDAPAPCAPGAVRLCLQDGRFAVSAEWRTAAGAVGAGHAAALTTDTGINWFFRPDNVELVLKVLDACPVFGRYWVFAAGLTDVTTAITVVDTARGERRRYLHAGGAPFPPLQDVDAFATCP